MGPLILAAFIAVPLIEIGLFIQVGGAIGLGATLFVVVATAVAGTALLRHQGLGALARLQQSLDRGEAPLEPVFDGFCLLAAGALLLTPGFFTDTVGFALFVPFVRHALRGAIAGRVQMHTHAPHGQSHGQAHGQTHGGPYGNTRGDIIDGEWQDVTDGGETPKLPPDPKRAPHTPPDAHD